jgi:hypothetical protein
VSGAAAAARVGLRALSADLMMSTTVLDINFFRV